jgi:NTP pyrophosphatase (non-canonical NTP hydrolase)
VSDDNESIDYETWRQRRMVRRGQISSSRDGLILAGLGLAGESGEVVDLIKKHLYHGADLDRARLLEEAGDVFWYLDEVLYRIGHSIGDAFAANDRKLEERYPHGFDGTVGTVDATDNAESAR